jgi:hypothetical protein
LISGDYVIGENRCYGATLTVRVLVVAGLSIGGGFFRVVGRLRLWRVARWRRPPARLRRRKVVARFALRRFFWRRSESHGRTQALTPMGASARFWLR